MDTDTHAGTIIINHNISHSKLESRPAPSEEEHQTFERFVREDDSEEALASIERITVSDLPRRINRYRNRLTKLKSGASYYEYNVFTSGIVYLSIAFDTRGLDMEEKRLLPLLVRCMQMCGTKHHDFRQVSTLIKMLTGSFFMYPNAGADVHHKPMSVVVVKSKMLRQDFSQAMDLIAELLTEPDLDDTMRIKASLTDMITEFESGHRDQRSRTPLHFDLFLQEPDHRLQRGGQRNRDNEG